MTPQEKPKRKTTTSSAVKAHYNKKKYTSVMARLNKDLVAKFRAASVKHQIPIAQVIRQAIEKFIEEYPPDEVETPQII